MRPEIQGFVGGVEDAEKTLGGCTLGMTVAPDDEMFVEMFWNLVNHVDWTTQPLGSHCDYKMVPEKVGPMSVML